MDILKNILIFEGMSKTLFTKFESFKGALVTERYKLIQNNNEVCMSDWYLNYLLFKYVFIKIYFGTNKKCTVCN